MPGKMTINYKEIKNFITQPIWFKKITVKSSNIVSEIWIIDIIATFLNDPINELPTLDQNTEQRTN